VGVTNIIKLNDLGKKKSLKKFIERAKKISLYLGMFHKWEQDSNIGIRV